MSLFATGISYKSAPVEIREKLAVGPPRLKDALAGLRDFAHEAVLVSTCNRVEVYAHSEGRESVREEVKRFLAARSGLGEEALAGLLYEYRDQDAARHLFKVASGMDSMVPGETQILAQVKDAYTQSAAAGMTGPVLNPLFQAAFRSARQIHRDSEISKRKVSAGSVAVDLAEEKLGRLDDKRVLMLGAGKMSEVTLRHLAAKGVRSIIVANRTRERALELAGKFQAKAVGFDTLDAELARADVVVASSAAPHYLVRRDRVRRVMEKRNNRPLLFIDIAVPRDVEPEVGSLENAYVYNIDDLQEIVDKNLTLREGEVGKCLQMVEGAAERHWKEAKHTDASPLIQKLTEHFHGIRKEELERSKAKFSRASQEYVREVERLTERLVNRLLHEPLKAIRAEASREKDSRRRDLLRALSRLFNMPPEQGDPPRAR